MAIHRGKSAGGERLLPALLDRLTDLEPDKSTEAADKRAMSKPQFRRSVLRDLAWLMNSTNAESDCNFEGFHLARHSVVNYGLPSLSGKRLSELDWPMLEMGMREAIAMFEPRILPETLEVKAIKNGNALDQHNLVAFEIRGQLWSEPYPIELLLRSSIDLESGHVVVQDTTGVG
jgi:type VI secretion system protein ImpF